MLEIVFNESVLGSMEQAAINATHRKPENLFCFPLPLDRGDIQKEFAVAREPLAALLTQAKDTPLRIWSSDAPQEKCGLYWLVAQLEPLSWENLDVSLVELPAFLEREDGVVVQYRAWGEVCPEEWSRWKTAGVRLPSPLLRAMADRWKELRRENAPLRAICMTSSSSRRSPLSPKNFGRKKSLAGSWVSRKCPFPMSFWPCEWSS